MKSLLNTAAIVIAISAIAIGTASAMIPTTDLTVNVHPDAGAAAGVLSDNERGMPKVPSLVFGTDFSIEDAGTQTGTQELRDLIGKHFI